MQVIPSRNERTDRRARDRGASLVEYALLLALLAVVAISAVTFLGSRLSESFDSSGESITAAT